MTSHANTAEPNNKKRNLYNIFIFLFLLVFSRTNTFFSCNILFCFHHVLVLLVWQWNVQKKYIKKFLYQNNIVKIFFLCYTFVGERVNISKCIFIYIFCFLDSKGVIEQESPLNSFKLIEELVLNELWLGVLEGVEMDRLVRTKFLCDFHEGMFLVWVYMKC